MCVVLAWTGNVETILWRDGHTELWQEGKFDRILSENRKDQYTDDQWRTMFESDNYWWKRATEFYIDPLPVWRQELQVALDGNTVDYHKTWISLVSPEERMEVTQIYRKVDKKVLCCIIPWDVASKRSGNKNIYCMRNQCIMLWPDRSVDVYNMKDMTYVDHIGSVGGAFNDVWGELWTCYVKRWEPTPDVPTRVSPAREDEMRTLLSALGRLAA